jgi:hypothetical protein
VNRATLAISLLLVFPAPAGAGSHFVWESPEWAWYDASDAASPDVSHWFDAEKHYWTYDDDLMCWAASASNVLAFSGWAGKPYAGLEDRLFAGFLANDEEDSGALARTAWQFYFEGAPTSGCFSDSTPALGHFDSSDWRGAYPHLTFADYYRDVTVTTGTLDTIEVFVRDGWGVVAAVKPDGWIYYLWDPVGHAITIWGYETDGAGDITGLWYTDSDDDKDFHFWWGNTWPTWITEPNNLKYSSLYAYDEKVGFGAFSSILGPYYVDSFAALAPSTYVPPVTIIDDDEPDPDPFPIDPPIPDPRTLGVIPEPASVVLVGLGLLGLGLAARRRRRA